jgi:hypothetical protein
MDCLGIITPGHMAPDVSGINREITRLLAPEMGELRTYSASVKPVVGNRRSINVVVEAALAKKLADDITPVHQ